MLDGRAAWISEQKGKMSLAAWTAPVVSSSAMRLKSVGLMDTFDVSPPALAMAPSAASEANERGAFDAIVAPANCLMLVIPDCFVTSRQPFVPAAPTVS